MRKYTENSVTVKKWNDKGDVCYGTLVINEPVATKMEFVDCGFKPTEIKIINASRVESHYNPALDAADIEEYAKTIMAVAANGDKTLTTNCCVTRTQLTGTVSVIAGALSAVVGVGTAFTTELAVGDYIMQNSEVRKVAAITDDTNLTVDTAFDGASAAVDLYLATPATGEEVITDLLTEAGTAFSGILPVERGFIIGSAHALNVDNAVLSFVARK